MSLDFTKYNAVITIENERYSVMLIDFTSGNLESRESFETLKEARDYVGKINVNDVIEITPTDQDPAFEETSSDSNFSTPSGKPPLPDVTDEQSQLDFLASCKQQNLFVEDGVDVTPHSPDPLSVEETQGDSPATDLPSPKGLPDYKSRIEPPQDNPSLPSGGIQDPKTTQSQKANVDLQGMKPENRNAVLNNPSGLGGVLGSQLSEASPRFKEIAGDKVWSGQNNQWLVFTRDRPGNINTGFQALGHTQAGAIDMVVGRMSPHPREIDSKGRPIKCSPIFLSEKYRDEDLEIVDAARIYMSQKTNIDINFGLAKGYMGNKTTQSAIGIKADAVRIISRGGGIKMVTNTPREMNSQGAKSNTESPGVEIIAGNDDTNLQPMVLGDNLRELLNLMCQMISEINGTVSSITTDMEKLNSVLSNHNHFGGDGIPTTPDPRLQVQCMANLIKLASIDKYSQFVHNWNNSQLQNTYLGASSKKSTKSILSKSNRVN
jgi:hypothetical protein